MKPYAGSGDVESDVAAEEPDLQSRPDELLGLTLPAIFALASTSRVGDRLPTLGAGSTNALSTAHFIDSRNRLTSAGAKASSVAREWATTDTGALAAAADASVQTTKILAAIASGELVVEDEESS